MRSRFIILIISVCCVLSFSYCTPNRSIIAAGSKVQLLESGFTFTEGPAVAASGDVYFTDQPSDRILRWSTAGELSVFLQGTGRSNGLYFDAAGNLLACADSANEIWSIDPQGVHTVILSGIDSFRFSGPNDLWVHPSGGIYFTDPFYPRSYRTRPEPQVPTRNVYYLSPDRASLITVDANLVQPNGIIGTPDGKRLYVADIDDAKTYVYDINADGTLSNRTLFVELGSDGMTIDDLGNIYLTGDGVTVFNDRGEQIEHIPVEASWTANVCFGGEDRKTLFITAMEGLYGLRMNVRGVQ